MSCTYLTKPVLSRVAMIQ
uniref:Uncharacterized protein n=1 Tax=Arundo donax TaxID=35708 RepID=A0A0A8YT70_ARUDO